MMLDFPNAKINLGLQIKSKRPDGYHEIETCLYPIALKDIIEVLPAKEDHFFGSGIPINGNDQDNLCIKALNLIRKSHSTDQYYIHLHKIIPHGAGLGGGSADAVFTLKLINELNELNMSSEELMNLASQIGSDCAFFLDNKTAIAKGRGEILESIDLNLSRYFIVLIHPGFSISTSLAYSLIKAQKPKNELAEILKSDISEWHKYLINDFQSVLELKFPELKTINEMLYDMGAIYAAMSGSGSAYFGIFENLPEDISSRFKESYFVWTSAL